MGSADDEHNSELDENTIRASEDAETEGAEALLGLAQSLFLLGAQPLPEPTAPATTFQACPSPPTMGRFLLSSSFQTWLRSIVIYFHFYLSTHSQGNRSTKS